MKYIKELQFDTKDGKAVVSEIYISELGYLMVKLYFPELKIFKGYNLMDCLSKLNEFGIFIENNRYSKVMILDRKNN